MVEADVVLPGVGGVHLQQDGHEEAHLLVGADLHELAEAVLGGAGGLGVRVRELVAAEEVGVAFEEEAVSVADRELWRGKKLSKKK